MNHYLFSSLIFIMMICFNADANHRLARDPFNLTDLISCTEQTNQLLAQIQSWQLSGIIQSQHNNYYQIWLTSTQQWLAIINSEIPTMLLPWQIKTLTNDNVVWQANLAQYCQDSIVWMMPLNK